MGVCHSKWRIWFSLCSWYYAKLKFSPMSLCQISRFFKSGFTWLVTRSVFELNSFIDLKVLDIFSTLKGVVAIKFFCCFNVLQWVFSVNFFSQAFFLLSEYCLWFFCLLQWFFLELSCTWFFWVTFSCLISFFCDLNWLFYRWFRWLVKLADLFDGEWVLTSSIRNILPKNFLLDTPSLS